MLAYLKIQRKLVDCREAISTGEAVARAALVGVENRAAAGLVKFGWGKNG